MSINEVFILSIDSSNAVFIKTRNIFIFTVSFQILYKAKVFLKSHCPQNHSKKWRKTDVWGVYPECRLIECHCVFWLWLTVVAVTLAVAVAVAADVQPLGSHDRDYPVTLFTPWPTHTTLINSKVVSCQLSKPASVSQSWVNLPNMSHPKLVSIIFTCDCVRRYWSQLTWNCVYICYRHTVIMVGWLIITLTPTLKPTWKKSRYAGLLVVVEKVVERWAQIQTGTERLRLHAI